jgi:hypothetical protein
MHVIEQQYLNHVARCFFFYSRPIDQPRWLYCGGSLGQFMKKQMTGERMEQDRKPNDIREDI